MSTLSTPNSREAIQPKRILMISAAFPPIAASGVRRTAKFAKYLGRFDFEPIIWASDRTDGVMIDKLSGEDLPHDLQVHYGGDQKIGGLRNLFRRKSPLIPWPLDRRETRALKHNPYIDWAQASLDALGTWLSDTPVDLIHSNSSVPLNHLVAHALHRALDIPWVADLQPTHQSDGAGSPVEQFFLDRLERLILDEADMVTTASPLQTRDLADRAPDRADRFFTVLDGYDPADFSRSSHADRFPPPNFVLTYMNRFEGWMVPSAFIDALEILGDDRSSVANHLELRIVGDLATSDRKRLEATGARIVFAGAQPYVRTVEELIRADALLMGVPDNPALIPERTIGHLASGHPILLIGPEEGACWELVRSVGAGICVPNDPTAIADAMRNLLHAWGAGGAIGGSPPPRLRDFTHIALTKKLAWYLDQVCDLQNVTSTSGAEAPAS